MTASSIAWLSNAMLVQETTEGAGAELLKAAKYLRRRAERCRDALRSAARERAPAPANTALGAASPFPASAISFGGLTASAALPSATPPSAPTRPAAAGASDSLATPLAPASAACQPSGSMQSQQRAVAQPGSAPASTPLHAWDLPQMSAASRRSAAASERSARLRALLAKTPPSRQVVAGGGSAPQRQVRGSSGLWQHQIA